MVGITTCAGCKHNWYSAPSGTDHIKTPHSRCLHFAENIPAVIEKRRGCDGKFTNEWVDSIKPPECPTFPKAKDKNPVNSAKPRFQPLESLGASI